MRCPRCGAEMDGGVCNECGFPVTIVKYKKIRITKTIPRQIIWRV